MVNTFTLDGEGKRRRLEDAAGLRNLLWDLENILVETDSGQATVARYTLAPQLYGELLSQRRSRARLLPLPVLGANVRREARADSLV